jgi:prevent-host-death family protein
MATFDIHQAKTHFSRLVERAAAGEEVIIAKAGRPLAKLISVSGISSGKQARKIGLWAGQMKVPENYNDPLPDKVLATFEGGAPEGSDPG